MMTEQGSKYFSIHELVPENMFNYLGAERCMWLIDVRLWPLLDAFREYFKVPIIVNNWHTGGKFNESGWRGSDSKTGASLSQHRYGRAADLKFTGLTDYDEIREEVKKNFALFEGLTTIEADTPTWLHVDIRNTGSNELLIVPYK